MDSINPTPPPRALGAVFGAKFYRYRSLLKRQWWILAVAISLGLAYEGWTIFKKADLYESSSELMVRAEVTGVDPKVRETVDSLYGDTLKMLQSSEILEKAKGRVELEAPQLSGQVAIVPSVAPRTSIFTVVGSGTNPEYTRRFVDAVVTEFIAFRRSQATDVLLDTSGEVSAQLKAVRTSLAAQQKELQDFVQANDMQFWQARGSKAAETLNGLLNRQTQLKTELQNLENLTPDELLTAPALQAPTAKGDAKNPGTERKEAVFNNELYAQYLETTQAVFQKKAELDERSTVWKPKHPRLQALQADLTRLERKLDLIKAQNIESTKSRAAAVTAELKSNATMVETWTKEVQEASIKDGEYQRLQSAVARSQGQEDKLLEKLTQVDPSSGGSGIFKVIRKATAPTPVSKAIGKHLFIGLFAGLVIGSLMLFLLDRSDDRLSTSSEVIQHFSEPILGQIPNVTDTRKETGLPLLQLEDERYSFAESFRSLRSSLIFMPNQSELKTLLITSAIPNEGKSTVASNLAITMAAGRRASSARGCRPPARRPRFVVRRGRAQWPLEHPARRSALAFDRPINGLSVALFHPARPGHQPVRRAASQTSSSRSCSRNSRRPTTSSSSTPRLFSPPTTRRPSLRISTAPSWSSARNSPRRD